MGCAALTLSAIDARCDTSVGGVKEVYVGSFGEIVPGTPSSGVISALSLANNKKMVIFRVRPGAASMEINANIDNDNGAAYIETTTAITFTKMEAAKRVQMQALLAGGAMAIIRDNNDKYWYNGYDNPLQCASLTGGTGVAFSDANRYALSLIDTSKELPYEVASSAITSSVIDDL